METKEPNTAAQLCQAHEGETKMQKVSSLAK